MKLNQKTASAFADEIGVQRSSVSHILSGRNKPSLEFIQKLIKCYPKVDAIWLIDGSTNVIPKDEKISASEAVHHEIVDEVKKQEPETKKMGLAQVSKSRNISRIVVFYDDNTFSEFTHS